MAVGKYQSRRVLEQVEYFIALLETYKCNSLETGRMIHELEKYRKFIRERYFYKEGK